MFVGFVLKCVPTPIPLQASGGESTRGWECLIFVDVDAAAKLEPGDYTIPVDPVMHQDGATVHTSSS